jgi:hypothetical protein
VKSDKFALAFALALCMFLLSCGTDSRHFRLEGRLMHIGQSEFYQAQAVGLKPEIKFVIADFADYQNEKKLKFTPYGGTEEVYTILRTYRTKNQLEIVCKRGIDE